ncbi:MAG: hypothetical protein HKP56_07455 [Anderseniella sp.]|nr:hypothetical protein [Anderseniella sp.]
MAEPVPAPKPEAKPVPAPAKEPAKVSKPSVADPAPEKPQPVADKQPEVQNARKKGSEKPADVAVEKPVAGKTTNGAADVRHDTAETASPCKPRAQEKPKKTRSARKQPAKKAAARKKRSVAKKAKGTNAA